MSTIEQSFAILFNELDKPEEDVQVKQLNRLNLLQFASQVAIDQGQPIPNYFQTELFKIENDYIHCRTDKSLNEIKERRNRDDQQINFHVSYAKFRKFKDYDEQKFKTEQLLIQQQAQQKQHNVVLNRGIHQNGVFKLAPKQETIEKQINSTSDKPTYTLPQSLFTKPEDKQTQGFITAAPPKTGFKRYQDENNETGSKSNQQKKFKPPSKIGERTCSEVKQPIQRFGGDTKMTSSRTEMDPRLKQLDPTLLEKIENEIMDPSVQNVRWEDVAGLDYVRTQIEEIAIWPLLNPELFHGITQPGSGLLLFGPPGTGKTMIGKAIANQAKATFFNISSSSLTSKWIGEAEKLVRTLFALATVKQPSVIFIDEIDSILSARQEKENECSRSMKTEFMVQLDGAAKTGYERVLLVGATNRPQELDDAIRRRFQRRLYIPLPNFTGRSDQLKLIIRKENERGKRSGFDPQEFTSMVHQTKGYSGADIKNLCTEMFLIPIRESIRVHNNDLRSLRSDQIRETVFNDFTAAIKSVKPTVQSKELNGYLDWNNEFGSCNFTVQDLDC